MEITILFGRVPVKDGPRESRAAQSAAGRKLLESLLADAFPGETVEIAKTRLGKPYLPTHPEVGVSISHSGELAVAALGPGRIGIDLERIRQPGHGAMRRYFTQREREEAETGGGEVFTRIWTQKEALGKALGTGIASRALFEREITELAAEMGFSLYAVPVEEGYVCTLAAEEKGLRLLPKCDMIEPNPESKEGQNHEV